MNRVVRNTLIAVAAIIVIAFLSYFVWREKQASELSSLPAISTSTSTLAAATSTGVSVTVSGNGTSTSDYTITPITGGNEPIAPNYKTPLSFSNSMSVDEQAQYQSQFATIQSMLASSPTDFGSWINLGILRQDTADYAGAAADWEYVTEIYPSDPTAFADLGELYATYLHDDTRAIANYKEAIKLDPAKELSFYQNLAQVYLGESDTADAKAVLQQGINAQVIGYQSLQTELNSLQ